LHFDKKSGASFPTPFETAANTSWSIPITSRTIFVLPKSEGTLIAID
jgi:hypothetical protein